MDSAGLGPDLDEEKTQLERPEEKAGFVHVRQPELLPCARAFPVHHQMGDQSWERSFVLIPECKRCLAVLVVCTDLEGRSASRQSFHRTDWEETFDKGVVEDLGSG